MSEEWSVCRVFGLITAGIRLTPPRRALVLGEAVIILGVILIIIGVITGIGILYTIGAILAVVGLILTILGAVGRGVGGRKTYF